MRFANAEDFGRILDPNTMVGNLLRFACRGTACRTLLVRSPTMQEKGTASRTPTCELIGLLAR